MRASSVIKLLALVIAALFLIYGLWIAFAKTAPMPLANSAANSSVNSTNTTINSSTSASEEMSAINKAAAQIQIADSYDALVKKSVQRLEEGNAAQSFVDIGAAIDMAKLNGASATEVDALKNMQARIVYCQSGPAAMLTWVATPEAALAVTDPLMPAALDRSRMNIEALLAQGKLQESWDASKQHVACFDKPGPGQAKEPLALEQAIRIAATAGANDQIAPLEKRLRSTVDAGITLATLKDVQLPLATLGTLAKARGDCLTAIKLYDQALEGFDTNRWLREKRVAPWRLQILALVAMDRVDCIRQVGEIERAKGKSTTLAADLATALGEQDPLAIQAADLRDQVLYSTSAP